jgi:signal transduction histidine kinase
VINLLHSRKTGYFLLVLAVLALEIFLGWRASIMYEAILVGQIGLVELNIIKWLVFFAIAVFGFTLSVHRHYGAEAIVDHMKTRGKQVKGWAGIATAMFIVILHDLSATVYTVFGNGRVPTFPLIAASIGMCCLCFIPFLMSRMMRALHDGVADEQEERHKNKLQASAQQHQQKLQQVTQKQQIKAAKQGAPALAPLPMKQGGQASNGHAPSVNGQNGGASHGTSSF